MRLSNSTSTVKAPSGRAGIDLAIVTDNPARAFVISQAAKRAFDIVVATGGMVLLLPTFLLISIAIKNCSRGPVFVPQRRHSHNNEIVPVLKFRTSAVYEGLLRRTGIGSLPQLVNVLRGEMSIVGTSLYVAPPKGTFAEHISLIRQAGKVKPGMIGWAQVNGCCGQGDRMIQQRIERDLYYIENLSFFLDIRIIIMTLFSKGAHSS
jgi:lipopolysaccharide/colanic/teichoic acid biosynthesis glycosyltransferase